MATGKIDIWKKLILKRWEWTYGSSLAGNTTRRWLPGAVGYTIPDGYVPIGIPYYTTGSAWAALDYLLPYNNSDQSTSYLFSIRNVTSSSIGASTRCAIEILFAPEEIAEVYSPDSNNKKAVFKYKGFSGSYSSLATNTKKAFTQTNCDFSIPDGYEVFGIRSIYSGNYNVSLSDFDPFSESRFLTIRNTTSSAQSGTASLAVVFINSDYKEQILA